MLLLYVEKMKTTLIILSILSLCMLGSCKKDPNGGGNGNNTTLRPYTADEQYFAGTIRNIGIRVADPNSPNYPNDTMRQSYPLKEKYNLSQEDSKKYPYGRMAVYTPDTLQNIKTEVFWFYDSASNILNVQGNEMKILERFPDSCYYLGAHNAVVVLQLY